MIASIMLSALPLAMPPYGGEPPWGGEQPARIAGEVRRGETFQQPIGDGLYLRLAPEEGIGWRIEIGPATRAGRSDRDNDFARCVTGPAHGPTAMDIEGWHFRNDNNTGPRERPETPGIGEKRWFDFVLTRQDMEIECDTLDRALYLWSNPAAKARAEGAVGARRSGRGWLKITGMKLGNLVAGEHASIESMTFEAEVALHGALELWVLPATYVIPDDFSGWVSIYARQAGQPASPQSRDRYVFRVSGDGVVRTSSELRIDRRGARFVSPDGKAIATQGAGRKIWGWQVDGNCSPYQTFFVGTRDQFRKSPRSPVQATLTVRDCSRILPKKSDGR
jgi:hypothetical protein